MKGRIKILVLIILLNSFLQIGCENGFNDTDEVDYSLGPFTEYTLVEGRGRYRVPDNSIINLDGKSYDVVVKELIFGENVTINGSLAGISCNKDGLNSGSLTITAESIKGSPIVELLGQSASYCETDFSEGDYLEFLKAKPLNAGKNGDLKINADSESSSFKPTISDHFSKGSGAAEVYYKGRSKVIDSGLNSETTKFCYIENPNDCGDIKAYSTEEIDDSATYIKSRTLSNNERIVSDKVIIESGAEIKLGGFNLLIEASEIIFEENVKFIGFNENETANCNKSGRKSGSVYLMAPVVTGSPIFKLRGENAGSNCSTSKRFGHCSPNAHDVDTVLNTYSPFSGGNSGNIYFLDSEGNISRPIIMPAVSSGSKPYKFRVFANHHWGPFGSSSCNWSYTKNVLAGSSGNQSNLEFLKVGPVW